MCVPLSLSLARAVLCLYVSTTGPVIIVIICIEFDELVMQTHSFGDRIRPNLGEFDGGKSKFSLKRSSTNFATKRSHFTKCILFRKRDCHHEYEFNHSTKGSPLRYARRRGRCESLSNWSICKCKMNSDCAFVQNLTLCVCVCGMYMKWNRRTRNQFGARNWIICWRIRFFDRRISFFLSSRSACPPVPGQREVQSRR